MYNKWKTTNVGASAGLTYWINNLLSYLCSIKLVAPAPEITLFLPLVKIQCSDWNQS